MHTTVLWDSDCLMFFFWPCLWKWTGPQHCAWHNLMTVLPHFSNAWLVWWWVRVLFPLAWFRVLSLVYGDHFSWAFFFSHRIIIQPIFFIFVTSPTTLQLDFMHDVMEVDGVACPLQQHNGTIWKRMWDHNFPFYFHTRKNSHVVLP